MAQRQRLQLQQLIALINSQELLQIQRWEQLLQQLTHGLFKMEQQQQQIRLVHTL